MLRFLRKLKKISCGFRKSCEVNADQWCMTLKFTKREILWTIILSVIGIAIVLCQILGYFLAIISEYFHLRVTLNLTFDEILFNLDLQMLFEIIGAIPATCYFLLYLWTTAILMNHSCWIIKSAILSVENLNSQLHGVRDQTIEENLKNIINMIGHINAWNKNLRDLMFINFFTEFTTLSLFMCLFVHIMAQESFSFLFLAFIFQFVCSCWMTTNVQRCTEELSEEINELDWHLLTQRDQESYNLLAMMARNMRSFDGIFYPFHLEAMRMDQWETLKA